MAHFCEADYDYFGRMETFEEDVEQIKKKLNIPDVINVLLVNLLLSLSIYFLIDNFIVVF